MKAAIIDDNIHFAFYLESVLKKSPDITSVNIYYSAEEFLDYYDSADYDLLFVDIGLPKQSGMDLVNIINGSKRTTQTVFVTGHPEFMAEAFHMNVSDYIVKPVSVERIFKTLEFVKKKVDNFQTSRNINNNDGNPDIKILLIRGGKGTQIVSQNDIIFIEKQSKKCLVHTLTGIVETLDTLELLQTKLDQKKFFRSHRSYIVNSTMISRIEKWSDRAYKIKMLNTNGEPLLSRTGKKFFLSFLSGEK